MRKKLIQHAFVQLLLISLLVTLGMTTKPEQHDALLSSSQPSVKLTANAADVEPTILPTPYRTEMISLQSIPAPVIEPVDLTDQEVPENIDSQPSSEEPPSNTMVEEKPSHTYEVTAYYLNVRTEPNAASAIVKVVKQGTNLEIIAVTDNGWLELKEGGFIKGSYATLIEEEAVLATAAISADENATIDKYEKIYLRTQIQANEDEAEAKREEIDSEPNEPTSVVASDSGLSINQIEKIFEGTELSGHGLEEAILEIEEDYGINAYFTIAVMKLESGNGKSKLAKKKNNLFGLNAIDGDKYNKAFSFKTKGDSVRKFGQLLSKNYVGKGLKTVEKVAKKYCPANSKWSGLVKNIMKSDYRKL